MCAWRGSEDTFAAPFFIHPFTQTYQGIRAWITRLCPLPSLQSLGCLCVRSLVCIHSFKTLFCSIVALKGQQMALSHLYGCFLGASNLLSGLPVPTEGKAVSVPRGLKWNLPPHPGGRGKDKLLVPFCLVLDCQ